MLDFLNKRGQKGVANGEQAGSSVNKHGRREKVFLEQARGKGAKQQGARLPKLENRAPYKAQ